MMGEALPNKKSIEPLWWGLFSAGGVVAAFLVPIHIVLLGLAVPMGWISDAPDIFGHWFVKVYLFVFIAMPLYHWAHRFYFTLSDIGLKSFRKPISFLTYGGAMMGTVITAWILLRL